MTGFRRHWSPVYCQLLCKEVLQLLYVPGAVSRFFYLQYLRFKYSNIRINIYFKDFLVYDGTLYELRKKMIIALWWKIPM